MESFKAYYSSPVGTIEVSASSQFLDSLKFINNVQIPTSDLENVNDILKNILLQFDSYFKKKSIDFDIPINPTIGTDFQRKVWNEVKSIPFGKTKSYSDIAKKLGDPDLVRAVGAANGLNPFLIIIPCHRVIGNDGALVGYAGGIWRKKWLLDFESPTKQLEFGF